MFMIRLILLTFMLVSLSGMTQAQEARPDIASRDKPKILFIRGGDATGGFLEAKTPQERTEQLADIENQQTFRGNHGWATLAQVLQDAGFELTQMKEGPQDKPSPIDLKRAKLDQYAIVVFGSNNQIYTPQQADIFWDYIHRGGSALFISDANFGPDWASAPNSDQSLLQRSGVVVNQDHGTYILKRSAGDFVTPDHPILQQVNQIDGEGVSPIVTPEQPVEGFKITPIVRAAHKTRENAKTKQGKTRDVTDRDMALLLIEHGKGRVACHFDRNTFFNRDGAGTSIHRFDNRRYAINLFHWLAGRTPG